MLATGNSGPYLDEAKTGTYLSLDGGLSWKIVANTSHIYQIGDKGGLLIMAEDSVPTKSIKFSWDMGSHWEEMEISEEPLLVTNIAAEPSTNGLIFLVYGVSKYESSLGFMITIDFSRLLPRKCSLKGGDYETWYPHSPEGECMLGEKLAYRRRNSTSLCFNPRKLQFVKREKICKCQRNDWECDFGFGLDSKGDCIRDDGKVIDYSAPDDCEVSYSVNIGYRKISGDKCVGGLDLSPKIYLCPAKQFIQ